MLNIFEFMSFQKIGKVDLKSFVSLYCHGEPSGMYQKCIRKLMSMLMSKLMKDQKFLLVKAYYQDDLCQRLELFILHMEHILESAIKIFKTKCKKQEVITLNCDLS